MFLSFLFFRHFLVHSLHSWAWQRARVVTDGSVLTRERSESHVKNVGAGGVMSLWQWWWKSGFNTVWIVFIMCVCAFWKKSWWRVDFYLFLWALWERGMWYCPACFFCRLMFTMETATCRMVPPVCQSSCRLLLGDMDYAIKLDGDAPTVSPLTFCLYKQEFGGLQFYCIAS